MKPAGVYNLNYIVEYIFPGLPFFAVVYKSKDLRCAKTRITAIGELLPGRSEGPAEGVIDLWSDQNNIGQKNISVIIKNLTLMIL